MNNTHSKLKISYGLTYIRILTVTFLVLSCSSIEKLDVQQEVHYPINDLLELTLDSDVSDDDMLNMLDDNFLSDKEILEPEIKLSFDVKNMPAKLFFEDLANSINQNILLAPQINIPVTLKLNNVNLKAVFSALEDSYNLNIQQHDYGYRVMLDSLQTRIFTVNYLNITRKGQSDTGVSSGNISGENTQSSKVETSYSSDFWSELEQTLKMMITNQSNNAVVVNPQAGMVIVKALSSELKIVEHFLEVTELSANKQVIIEAKILEVNLSDQYKTGINWNTFAGQIAQIGSNVLNSSFDGNAVNPISDVGGVFNLNINSGDFSGIVQLLQHQGEVQVLSTPRISTVNNQKAVIKVGTDEFFVTNIDSGSSSEDGGSAPGFTLTPFFSGIALDVTPQISLDNEIILHIRPSVIEVSEKTKVISIDNKTYQLPLAFSSIRESDSIIRAKSGEIIIIGGLLQNKQSNSQTGLPWFARLPIIGGLFGQTQDVKIKSELVILLKPIVVDANTWRNEVEKTFKTTEFHNQ
ncbi:MAG: pilus (MSHA type) biogenesis protein MshL [Saccharospirillaceae bacterium]|nr:pilus (MSHA type) biogenesis protein MshL [Pseudomonadales bacterium]NRB77060.1 pilus (MSHA type) biogenesis protein MshL [Saccharospirillaceae bacterium]